MPGTTPTLEEPSSNPALRIAESTASSLRVLAGPGSGKTYALMRRVEHLLTMGVPASRIFLATFARTAAHDLRQELDRLGVMGAEAVRAGTLHGFCFSVLSRRETFALTGRVPRPLLEFETRFLLEDLVRGFGGVRERRRRLLAFNAAWSRLQSEEPGWPPNEDDRRFQRDVVSWLQFHRAMLLGEIVPETLRYLRDNPACPERVAFDHVLVDEYQDLNRAEQVLLDVLSAESKFTVVGDEDQSIYSFKHAHPEGIRDFVETHPGTRDEALTECRRCPKLIVTLANHFIAQNSTRQARSLSARAENPVGEVHIVQWANMNAEAAGIATFLADRIHAGQVPGRILVLAPRRQFGQAIRDALAAKRVEAHSFFQEEALEGDPKVLEDSRAQQALTLLTLAARSEDRMALRAWCGFGSADLRAGAWSRLRAHCEEQGAETREALQALREGVLVIRQTRGLIDRETALMRELSRLDGLRGSTLVDALLPRDEPWAQPLRGVVANMEQTDFDATILHDALRTAISQPELPTVVEYVRVMSLHKSKGLTADVVVVAGCNEGVLPYIDAEATDAEQRRSLEEQRRLFYVAMTRATKTLVLSSVQTLPFAVARRMRVPLTRGGANATSRFIGELGPARPMPILGESFLRLTVSSA
ncbi:MAG: ATP-dependent helicase [Thermoanaerobaculia bacterium]